jgi:inorganic triphosphatase YgiF
VSSDPFDPARPVAIVPAGGAGSPREAPPPAAPQGRGLRLALAPESLPRLRRHPLLLALTQGRPARRALRVAYFDTATFDLARGGLLLRVRRVGRHHVQTLERIGPAAEVAGALESLVADGAPDLARLPDPAERVRALELVAARPLSPAFEIDLVRLRRALREDASELTFDLEIGEIRWGGASARRMPVCELELTAGAGDPGHPWRLALELLDELPLRPSPLGLAERGLALAADRAPEARKAARFLFDENAPVEALLVAVVEACLDQVLANESAARAGVDPEGVHQMRVGLRRLRSALAFFAPMIPAAQRERLRGELGWLASELGDARDLDVFTGELLPPLQALRPDDAALARLRDTALGARTEGYARARAALDSARYPRLVLELGLWLARRAWRDQPLSEHSAALFQPARSWAAALLERRYRKARKLGRRLATSSPAERHRLRIRLKKLRYGAEFSRGLFPLKRTDRSVRRLAELQDVLGRLNDAALGERLVTERLARDVPDSDVNAARAAGLAAGWFAHASHREAEALVARWERFEKTGRFWPHP